MKDWLKIKIKLVLSNININTGNNSYIIYKKCVLNCVLIWYDLND